MKSFFGKIFGSKKEKSPISRDSLINQIEALELEYSALTDDALKNKTEEFISRFRSGETLDDLLPESFATMREAAWRVLGEKHSRVQLLGGIALHQGCVADIKPGEGKALTVTLPAYLNALSKNGVHVATANEHVARRECGREGKVFEFLQMSTGVNVHGLNLEKKKRAYEADITYGSTSEFAYDYIRDNLATHKHNTVQRDLNYAIIDRVDVALLDNALVPLNVYGEGENNAEKYVTANHFFSTLEADLHYIVSEQDGYAALSDEGMEVAENYFSLENSLLDPLNTDLYHHIHIALKANLLMKRDEDYMVEDGEIIVIDKHSGESMVGIRYRDGLHQALEAKEKLEIRPESRVLGTITLPNYISMYKKNAGITGTLNKENEGQEFKTRFGMDVVVVPTIQPVIRVDYPDAICRNKYAKYASIAEEVTKRHEVGQPVLVDTQSVECSERISSILKEKGVNHKVLNGKQREDEAEILGQAGRKGAVTIATSMVERASNIPLGGNPCLMAKKELFEKRCDGTVLESIITATMADDPEIKATVMEYEKLCDKCKQITDKEFNEVISIGGLHIIGSERYLTSRKDNQLRCIAGQQGKPGSSQFFVSLEDDLLRFGGGERLLGMVEKLGMDDNVPIEHGILAKSIDNAQKKLEGHGFGFRKYTDQLDEVVNKQRELIYSERRKVLYGEHVKEELESMVGSVVDHILVNYTSHSEYPEEWALEELNNHLHHQFGLAYCYSDNDIESLTKESLREQIMNRCITYYINKEKDIETERLREIERILMLNVIDNKWMDHIVKMDLLKQGINLRAIGQENPVRAYQLEGYNIFQEMICSIQEETVRALYNTIKEAVK